MLKLALHVQDQHLAAGNTVLHPPLVESIHASLLHAESTACICMNRDGSMSSAHNTIGSGCVPVPTNTSWKLKYQVFWKAFSPKVGKFMKPQVVPPPA